MQSGVSASVIRIEKLLASIALAAYCLWNAYWLAQSRLAPSILTALTGLPCPTTGGHRGIVALARGDLLGSLCWNPFAIPIAAFFCTTVVFALREIVRRRRPYLGSGFAYGWLFLLGIAWVCKLVEGAIAGTL